MKKVEMYECEICHAKYDNDIQATNCEFSGHFGTEDACFHFISYPEKSDIPSRIKVEFLLDRDGLIKTKYYELVE